MKYLLIFSLAVRAALAQTGTTGSASIAGTILDAKTLQPVPAALVIASRAGAAPFTKNTKSGGDGAFQLQQLTPGDCALYVQAPGDQYLDPCLWNASPTTVRLTSGQSAAGVSVKLTAASVLLVQLRDAEKVLGQLTKDGRHPELSVGVWGPGGLYYPAHAVNSPAAGASAPGSTPVYSYRLAVPRDTALNFSIASRDLKLGDGDGVALPANASRQTFQRATGDASATSFTFSVLGLLP
jgi:hypothetical protein